MKIFKWKKEIFFSIILDIWLQSFHPKFSLSLFLFQQFFSSVLTFLSFQTFFEFPVFANEKEAEIVDIRKKRENKLREKLETKI